MTEKIFTLSNGLKVIFVSKPDRALAGIGFFVRSGSRYESESMSGHAHFLEHIILKGPAEMSEPEFYRKLENSGAYWNGWTYPEFSYFSLVMPKEKFVASVGLISQAIINPRFDEIEVENEKKVILEERNQFRNSKNECLEPWEAMTELAWRGETVSNDILGTPEAIKKITIESLKKTHQKYYNSANSILVVAGDINAKEIKEGIKVFENLEGQKSQNLFPKANSPAFNGPHEQYTETDGPSARVLLAFKATSYREYDFWVKKVLSASLSHGWGSLFYSELRQKLGLIYDVWPEDIDLTDTGLLGVSLNCSPDKTIEIIEKILGLISEVKSGKKYLDIERAKSMLIGGLADRQDNLRSSIFSIGYSSLFDLPDDQSEAKGIKSVTESDVLKFMNKYLVPENLYLVYIGPESQAKAEQVKKILVRF